MQITGITTQNNNFGNKNTSGKHILSSNFIIIIYLFYFSSMGNAYLGGSTSIRFGNSLFTEH